MSAPLAGSYDTCRVARDDRVRCHAADHDSAGTDNGAGTHGHTGPDKGLRTHPGVVLEGHRRLQQRQGRSREIVRPGTDVGAIGDGDAPAKDHLAEAVDQDVLPQGRPLPYGEVPGHVYAAAWVDIDVGAYARPEQ